MREIARHRLVRDLRIGAAYEGKTGSATVAADLRFAPSQRGLSLRVIIVRPAKIGPIGVSPYYTIGIRLQVDLILRGSQSFACSTAALRCAKRPSRGRLGHTYSMD